MNLEELYRDLHRNPELGFAETRTAGVAARELRAAGYDTTEGVGVTGVVGVLRNGDGPTALLRADMDALPVEERTGLPYASTAVVDRDGHPVPVMHACGHDVHVTCLVGAARELAATRDTWRGTVLAVFQPAEEVGGGAQGMVDDGLFDRFGTPDVVLGQHVTPIPAGVIGLRPGPAFAAADTLKVTLYGEGGHGSRPESAVDPVVMAAATVLRLQTVVSREVSGLDTAVVTVGAINAGTVANIIPDSAELLLSVRSYTPAVRERVLAAIERIVRAEAAASGATRDPEITTVTGYPAVVNDPGAAARTRTALARVVTDARVVDPGPVTGSEDVGVFATAAGVPLVYWLLGGADPAAFAGATSLGTLREMAAGLPANHSPLYAPVPDPTLDIGVAALVSAAREWLPVTAG
ncbi:amidohydrolase [Actinosynnema sp. NPDC050436]|uniref:amidohydrolase n=1 Tax=Actinosynnema sp. NPDC050436 TaxID=3155659 RepID=UPI0033C63E6A